MMQFHAEVTSQRETYGYTAAYFNPIVRQAMTHAANLWATTMLPRHFDAGAFYRYKYAPRTGKYLRTKIEKKYIRKTFGRGAGLYVANPNVGQSPRPLVYTGEMRTAVLGMNLSPTAAVTSSRVSVKVRIPLPHPLNPKNAGELVRMTPDEREAVYRAASEKLDALIVETRLNMGGSMTEVLI